MSVFDVLNPLHNLTPRFTEEQLSQIIEWFDNQAKPLLVINDGEPINVITIENLKEFLELKKFHRRSFHYPSYAEIMKQAENLNAGTTRMLTREQLLYMLDKWTIEPNLKHEIKLAFQVFDTEKRNFLEIDEIKGIVTTYAEVFNETETREMLRDANVSGDGNVFYNDFVDSLFNIAPELYNIKAEYLYEDPEDDPSVPPEPVVIEEPLEKPVAAATPPSPSPPPPPPPAPSVPKKPKKK